MIDTLLLEVAIVSRRLKSLAGIGGASRIAWLAPLLLLPGVGPKRARGFWWLDVMGLDTDKLAHKNSSSQRIAA